MVEDIPRTVGAAIVYGYGLNAIKVLGEHTLHAHLKILLLIVNGYHYREFYVLFLFHGAKIVKKNVIVKCFPFFFITFAK